MPACVFVGGDFVGVVSRFLVSVKMMLIKLAYQSARHFVVLDCQG